MKSSIPELSERNQSLLALFSAEIEAAADQIISESPSPAARREALVWKAEAIPVMQTCLLNTDPIAAALDTWAFIFQMTAYMEKPASQEKFGKSYPIVAEALRNLNAEMEQLVQSAAPNANIADLRRTVGSWAEAHPIQASLIGRQSADADVIRKVEQSDLGMTASIKTLAEELGDFNARLDSYNVYLPKQARWQAELLLIDLPRDPEINDALSRFAVLSNSAAKVSNELDQMPALMDQTRKTVQGTIEAQRLSAQAFIDGERLKTLHDLEQERIATVAAMHGERVAAMADLSRERQAAMETLSNQELEIMNQVKTISEHSLQDADRRGRSMINFFFIRALELMLLTLVLCWLVGWIMLRQFLARLPDQHTEMPSQHSSKSPATFRAG